MEESLNIATAQECQTTDFNELKRLVGYDSDDMSPAKTFNLKSNENVNDSSDEDHAPVQRVKKRIHRFTDSDSDTGKEIDQQTKLTNTDANENDGSVSEPENICITHKSNNVKSRIQLNNSDSDSPGDCKINKYEEQQVRMKNKRNKMKDKFKSLLSSREKQAEPINKSRSNNDSENSDTEIRSIKTLKQKIKESMSMIPSICDPDTSDEEDHTINKHVNKSTLKNERKSTKLTAPKPIRMSAKQAMENMHKIKSESNRMLREKEVSLPYHRPKALTLKDIMSRRKPAVNSDGKALPIKMNEEQLRQYAESLEQRQKEMMVLCKSDTEDEEGTEADNKPEESLPEITPNFSDSTETDMVCENSEIKAINYAEAQAAGKVIIEDEEALQNGLTVIPIETSTVPEVNLPDNFIKIQSNNIDVNDQKTPEEQQTNMKLVFNDSVEETNTTENNNTESVVLNEKEGRENIVPTESNSEQISTVGTEPESQLINLHYDTEKSEKCDEHLELVEENNISNSSQTDDIDKINISEDNKQEDFLSDDDDDINMDDIDKIIENAELIENTNVYSPMLIREPVSLKNKPKLAGAPGMVIDLDGSDPIAAKKLSGVELLKERFIYFAQMKTPGDHESKRDKKVIPGAQHQKLKLELEEKISDQRSLEWAKRLEEEKQQHMEINSIRGDMSDIEDDIEKIEATLNESNEKESSSESEEELVEDDVEIKDKPRKHNPMLDEEAEETECDENEAIDQNQAGVDEGIDEGNTEDGESVKEDDDDSDESSDESSESEAEQTSKPKGGRILKAFEDSDDETSTNKNELEIPAKESSKEDKVDTISGQTGSQDVELQLAQRHKSMSDDIFSSQDALSSIPTNDSKKDENNTNDVEMATQTFSILDSKPSTNTALRSDEVNVLSATQPYHDPNLDALASGLTQSVISSQLPTQASQSQAIGEDVLALCTGKFYDNEFVSQADENQYAPISQESCTDDFEDDKLDKETNVHLDHINSSINDESNKPTESNRKSSDDGNLLKSILDELDDPDLDAPKPKFFTGARQKKDRQSVEQSQLKKKFIIESDDEADTTEEPRKKKLKKKKHEKRALQISDDEDEEQSELDEEQYMSDIEDDAAKNVEYDSEENEIEVKPQNPKNKRKATNFFEQEAELTSEDEWVGSGDEDEAGLDRMEREEGDDDVFHQGKLQKELGQIHMRDVLDQDKREVRLLQELLFEDGDLGDGHRQRKFRWRNADGDEETGTMVDEFGNTQEEEFEPEEQWRKQRHERAVFLRQMENKEDDLNVSVNRTTIIKANLSSKTMSSLLLEVNQSKTEKTESPVVPEKNTPKDIPSPKKSYTMFQQNYHGSLLARGSGALARLAALATPLATDDDNAPKIGSIASSSKRNFVFAALTPDEKPKVTVKRKADIGTPKLVKKIKTR